VTTAQKGKNAAESSEGGEIDHGGSPVGMSDLWCYCPACEVTTRVRGDGVWPVSDLWCYCPACEMTLRVRGDGVWPACQEHSIYPVSPASRTDLGTYSLVTDSGLRTEMDEARAFLWDMARIHRTGESQQELVQREIRIFMWFRGHHWRSLAHELECSTSGVDRYLKTLKDGPERGRTRRNRPIAGRLRKLGIRACECGWVQCPGGPDHWQPPWGRSSAKDQPE
jgi:hypothetical protein